MMYYFTKTLNVGIDAAVARVTEELKLVGFGILTEINVKETLKSKLDVDFKEYRILGACNPNYAYRALQTEDKIGVFLPCNVVVEDAGNGTTDVSAVDPVASMQSVNNPNLEELGNEVREALKSVIEKL
ncbi:MAG: DUF302 domain-containing protein [Ignavibacteria bacterium]|nr:DUF302 domain-containing protein [Ignavibacteria bacterium]